MSAEKYAPAKGDYIRVQGNKQYLPVPNRVQWFRGEHPTWAINTSVLELDWTAGYAVMRAEVLDDTGRLIASGTKTETRKGFGDFVEKAETGAVGRALARAGYGTEDALDLEDGRYADAPIEQPEPRGAKASSPRAAPAPDQYRREELAELMREKDLTLSAIEVYANLVGIPKGERATNDQMDALIDAVRGHGIEEGIEPAVARAADEAVAVPSPVESPAGDPPPAGPPPKPSTDAYRSLSAQEKANARAYWATHEEPEQETLAEALGAPLA